MSKGFDFERLVELCQRTHEETGRSAARAIDRSLVVRNWLFGWYIVEYEQSGADRTEYGRGTLKKLSAALQARIGRGFSVDVLDQMRRFYRSYDHMIADYSASDDFARSPRAFGDRSIPETPSRISRDQSISDTRSRISSGLSPGTVPSLAQLAGWSPLGWSHYVTLLSVADPNARRFYEIEAAENGWSVRELKRQLDSSLYERLALSRDKHEVRRLARDGQVVEKASDLIKDPVVLEFLGLEEKPAYSESDLVEGRKAERGHIWREAIQAHRAGEPGIPAREAIRDLTEELEPRA
ncbi:MAG: DUF1016 N-terminal domain-containing protein [Gemmatimonadota bacterium]|nr:DUF1016 N-terminal domain-containing protein [Gemmatimonadota bacterium]